MDISRESNKLEKRKAATISFYKRIDDLGGVISGADVCDLLSINPSRLINLIGNNEILFFEKDGVYIYPSLQFKEDGFVDGFPAIMKSFNKDVDCYFRFSFLTSVLNSIISKTPMEIISGGNVDEIDAVVRSASMLGVHIAE